MKMKIIKFSDILNVALGMIDEEISLTSTLEIKIQGNYLELHYRPNKDSGSMNYSGSYHPDGHCETPGGDSGICIYCGCTIF